MSPLASISREGGGGGGSRWPLRCAFQASDGARGGKKNIPELGRGLTPPAQPPFLLPLPFRGLVRSCCHVGGSAGSVVVCAICRQQRCVGLVVIVCSNQRNQCKKKKQKNEIYLRAREGIAPRAPILLFLVARRGCRPCPRCRAPPGILRGSGRGPSRASSGGGTGGC